jgi:hypothetical protein
MTTTFSLKHRMAPVLCLSILAAAVAVSCSEPEPGATTEVV